MGLAWSACPSEMESPQIKRQPVRHIRWHPSVDAAANNRDFKIPSVWLMSKLFFWKATILKILASGWVLIGTQKISTKDENATFIF